MEVILSHQRKALHLIQAVQALLLVQAVQVHPWPVPAVHLQGEMTVVQSIVLPAVHQRFRQAVQVRRPCHQAALHLIPAVHLPEGMIPGLRCEVSD